MVVILRRDKWLIGSLLLAITIVVVTLNFSFVQQAAPVSAAPNCSYGGVTYDCDDHNACTTDACGSPCLHTPIAGCTVCTTSADCNDSNVCTNDTCSFGVCAHTANSYCPHPTPSPAVLNVTLYGSNDEGSTYTNSLNAIAGSNISFKAIAGGSQTGSTTFNFYCKYNDVSPAPGGTFSNVDYTNGTSSTQEVLDLCNYTTAGTYTAEVRVTR